jgi:2-C-methyl-D-erythritol 2,4-cyclodiphosphate synthase
VRAGLGYDIHRVRAGQTLVLGGVEIPSDFGLDGHSDADVLLHALMDALLGAAALGDIGEHFPPTDDRYKGVSSVVLLGQVRELLARVGWQIVNIDVVVVAERPRIRPHVHEMTNVISNVLGIPAESVGIKATTNEGVGPEGRLEAISAQAVALIEHAP